MTTMNAVSAPSRSRTGRPALRGLSRAFLWVIGLLMAVIVVFLLLPSPIDSVAWMPPAAPDLTGVLAPNDALRSGVLIGEGEIRVPEDIAFDDQGRLYTGGSAGSEGEILRITLDGNGDVSEIETFVDTGGSPLDMRFDSNGNLIVADWGRGLISINPQGDITQLVAEETLVDGEPFRRGDGVAIGSDGTIYFSEGSRKDGEYNAFFEVIEARSYGRLLAYNPNSEEVRVLIPELYFGNGVALAPDESFVLVADQYRYRIARYWLAGEQAGTWDYFVENLPGFPHNIHYDENGLLWVALTQGRNALADNLHPYPFLKNQLAKLPESLFVASANTDPDARGAGIALAINSEGKIQQALYNPPMSLNTLSTAVPYNGALYLGSLDGQAILRYELE
jgi:sugar lactone lactonase YvrE